MDQETTTPATTSKGSKITAIVIVVLVVLAIVLYAVLGGKAKEPAKEMNVATVNGAPITQTAFDAQVASITSSAQAQGINVSASTTQAQIKQQALNNLIDNELIAEGIKASGIAATDAEIESQYQTLVTQNGGADGLKAALAKQNMTDEQLRANIASQLAIQKYLLANVKIDSITVTDKEISDFYNQYKQANGTSTPTLKDLSAQIKQQLTSNKQQTMINDFLASLRAKANVVTNITI